MLVPLLQLLWWLWLWLALGLGVSFGHSSQACPRVLLLHLLLINASLLLLLPLLPPAISAGLGEV